MKTIRGILETKGQRVHTIAPDATVFEALEHMARWDVGALVVVEQGEIVGLMSEREYARNVILKGRFSKDTPVRDVMNERAICVGPLLTVDDCMAIMTESRQRHLPVLDDGRLQGIVSIGDVVKAIMDHQQLTIEQLEQYIMKG